MGFGVSESPVAVAANLETVDVMVGKRAKYVATITLDRPEAQNAMNPQLRGEIVTVLEAIEGSDVRVVVLTGSDGSRSFASGADIEVMHDRSLTAQRTHMERPRIYENVESLRQPVIAQIDGHAFGGGCELALACDIRIAAETASLGFPEVSLGLIPGGGATQRLPRLIGEGRAMQLILSGDPIAASEASELGLVDIVISPDNVEACVTDLASSIAQNSPFAVALAKRSIQAGSHLGQEDGIDYEAELFLQAFAAADSTEGITAYLEERDPTWSES
jgi:enoyl-CoA hydratase